MRASVLRVASGVSLALLFCLLLSPKTGFAGAKLSFILTNNSGTAISSVVMTPENGKPAEQKTTAAPGATITLDRQPGVKMSMEFRHGSGFFVIPKIFFDESEKVAAVLTLEKGAIPVLRFPDEPQRNPVYGENSDWKFKQILGSFPYGPGVTTLARAKASGSWTEPAPGTLKGSVVWEVLEWTLVLSFAGEAPDSVLKKLEMTVKTSDDNLPMFIADALEEHEYTMFHSASWQGAQADFFASRDFAERWQATVNAKQGGGKGEIEARPGETIVIVSYPKGGYRLDMMPADDFVKAR